MTLLATVILAAGRGARLRGAAKAALLCPDGRTFVAAIVAAARGAGLGTIVCVTAAPHLEATEAAARAAGCDRIVRNPAPAGGMASSAAVGLAALDWRDLCAVLIWPVDHPFVRPDTVVAIAGAASRTRIVVPVHAGRGGHPTCFGAALLGEASAAAHSSQGLREVVGRDPARVLRMPVDDPGVVRDVDTPSDLVAVRGSRRAEPRRCGRPSR